MKNLFYLLIVVLLCQCGVEERAGNRTVPTHGKIKLKKFMGDWYEIARIPVPIGRSWVNTKDVYTLVGDDEIEIEYQGFSEDGSPKKFKQKGKVLDTKLGDRWQIKLFGGLKKVNYHILFLDEPRYDYCIVSDGTQKHVWILSREPELDQATYLILVKKAQLWGFDVSKVEKVRQKVKFE